MRSHNALKRLFAICKFQNIVSEEFWKIRESYFIFVVIEQNYGDVLELLLGMQNY